MQEVTAHGIYEIDCECGEVMRIEHDPSGEVIECDGCNDEIRVI